MIQADQRGGLGHAITLNNGVAHTLEKILSFVRESCAAGNERPEFPAKAVVDSAKHPDALEKFSTPCVFKSSLQPPTFPLTLEFPLDSGTKQIKHAWHGNERGGTLVLDSANDFGGIARRFEYDRGSKQRRHEQRHELPKDVAQRNERDETQRVKPALIFPVLFEATLQRLNVCQKISVSQNTSARLGRRAGGVRK